MSTELEKTVYDVVRSSIAEHLNKRLSESYRSPLDPFLEETTKKHAAQIQAVYDASIAEAFAGADFKAQLRDAFTHKLAKLLVARFEGEIEKRANELRQDASFRAKVTLAIEAAVKGQIA